MEKWYSREFISSTQTASRLVFNVGNCVDQSRILPSPPSRPPDALGKECYVYAMRGSAVTSIKELPVDELAPWNSKSCKSSTRFSEVSYDPQSGQIVMRRHAISDTSVVPGNLFACYYCRHPIFCLSKKIYYACYGNREACLPDTFVLFVYEFDGPEKLYARGYINAPAFSSSHQLSNSHHTAMLGRQRRSMEQKSSMQWETLYGNNTAGGDEGTASSSQSLLDQFLQSGANGEQQPCSLKFAEYLNESAEEAEEDGRDNPTTTTEPSLIDMMLKSLSESTATADGCGGEVGDGLVTAECSMQPGLRFPNQMDLTGQGVGTGTARTLALHSSLQTSSPYHPNNFKRLQQHRRQQRRNFPPPPSKDFNKRKLPTTGHATFDPEAKRRALGSSFGHPLLSSGPGTNSKETPSLPSNYRHIHISAAALENFKYNGLCAEDELVVMHDAFAELLNTSAATPCSLHEMTQQMHLGRHGGCLVAGLPLDVECAVTEGARRKLSFTCLWFRNNAFLTEEGHPVVHPLGMLVKSVSADDSNGQCHESLGHDYSCLLSDLESKLTPTSNSSRALLTSEAVQLDVSKFPRLLRYPCVSLHCLEDFKRMVWDRLSDVEVGVGRMVEEDIVGKTNVEDLCQSTGLLNSLRLEEFVRKLTLVERKWPVALRMWFREKSGWIFERLSLASRLKSGFAPLESATIAAQFEPLCDQLSKHLRPLTTSGELSPERITLLLDEFTNDVLSRSAQSLFDAPSAPTHTTEELRLNPCLAHLRVSRDAWSRMERAGRTAKLREIGLGALPEEELLLTASNSAALMLTSTHLGERSRRDKLALLNAASRLKVVSLESGDYATVDSDRRLSHFVGRDFYCQCNGECSSARWKLCEHLCAVGLAKPEFAQALSEWRNEETGIKSSPTCSPAACAEILAGEVRSEQDVEIEHKAEKINFARQSTLVEMIHCIGNGFRDEGESP